MKEIYNCLFVLSIFIFVFALSIAGDAACRGCNFCRKGQFLFCFLFVFVFVHLHWVFIFAYLHWIYIFVYLLLVPIFVYLHWVFIFVYLRIYFCLFTLNIAGDSAAGYSLFARGWPFACTVQWQQYRCFHTWCSDFQLDNLLRRASAP